MAKKVFAIKLGSYIFIKPYPSFENGISGFH